MPSHVSSDLKSTLNSKAQARTTPSSSRPPTQTCMYKSPSRKSSGEQTNTSNY